MEEIRFKYLGGGTDGVTLFEDEAYISLFSSNSGMKGKFYPTEEVADRLERVRKAERINAALREAFDELDDKVMAIMNDEGFTYEVKR